MAGYREFQTGEVLTAANVNSFLMEQATMTFADAAARDAALASVLRAGLNVYLEDTDRLQYYDGTDWQNVPNESDVDAAGGLVAVKHVLKTDTFSASITAGDSEPITDLSITHAVAEAGNKVVLYAQIHGASGTNPQPRWGAGIAVDGVIFRGDADGTRRRVGGSTTNVRDIDDFTGSVITLAVVYEPPTTASAIYTAQIMSLATSTQNHYVNRTDTDGNTGDFGRGTSTLTLLEVKV